MVLRYRRDAEKGAKLVRHLNEEVFRAMAIAERAALCGETLLVVGSRNEAATFPYGFFKDWTLDANTPRFGRV